MGVVILSMLTLKQLFRLRRKIVVSCRHCKYSREYSGWHLAVLMQEFDENTPLLRLAERSKCSQCGVKRMVFSIEPLAGTSGRGPDEVA